MTEETLDTRLARIETKLDIALSGQNDHEARIRRLEKALFTAMGVAAALGGLLGAVGSRIVGMWAGP